MGNGLKRYLGWVVVVVVVLVVVICVFVLAVAVAVVVVVVLVLGFCVCSRCLKLSRSTTKSFKNFGGFGILPTSQ